MTRIYSPAEAATIIASHERRLKAIEAGMSSMLAQSASKAGTSTCSTTSGAGFGDCADGVGPIVSDVNVTTGNMLVIVSCAMISPPNDFGYMTFELSGPSPVAPSIDWALTIGSVPAVGLYASLVFPFVGGVNGQYVVTAKYGTASGGTASFAARTLTVMTGH